jgi:hypothetical protein
MADKQGSGELMHLKQNVTRLAAVGIALIACLITPTSASAQPFSAEIIRPAALPKDPLFTQTVLWIAESFRSAKDVIQLQDKELGTIVANGAFDMNIGALSFMPAVNVPVSYKVRIDMRDNRYRMTFSDVRVSFDGRPKPIEETNREPNERRVREHFEQLANSLDTYLAQPKKDF